MVTLSFAAGFKGNGQHCEDIDECADRTSGCDQSCTNTKGGWECSCKDGFTMVRVLFTMVRVLLAACLWQSALHVNLYAAFFTCLGWCTAQGFHQLCSQKMAASSMSSSIHAFVPAVHGSHVLPQFGGHSQPSLCLPKDMCNGQENGGCEMACLSKNGSAQCTCPMYVPRPADSPSDAVTPAATAQSQTCCPARSVNLSIATSMIVCSGITCQCKVCSAQSAAHAEQGWAGA